MTSRQRTGKPDLGAQRQEPHGRPARRRAPIFGRAICILVWLVALNMWLVQHLGLGLSEPGWLGLVAASFSAGVAIVEYVMQDREKKELTVGIRRFGRLLLTTPVIVALYLGSGIVLLGYSSVMMLSSQGKEVRISRLKPLSGGGGTWRIGKPERLIVRVGPFGRLFQLDVPGYLSTVVRVPPLTGLRIVAERDLRRPPTMLLRPPSTALGALEAQGASFRLLVSDGRGRWRLLCLEECKVEHCSATSFLVGRLQPVPSQFVNDWHLELLALGQMEDSRLAKTVLAWKRPKHLKNAPSLVPGTLLRAEVRSRSKAVVASAEVLVGDDDFLDTPLVKQ